MLHALAASLQCRKLAGFGLVGLFLAACALPAAAASVQLVMVERSDCRYCRDWHREIGPGYGESAEGRFAPLTRVQSRDSGALKGFNPVVYTPTFLVVRDGEEVGRITGYAGQMFFYEELDEQLAKAGFKPQWGIPDVGDKAQLDVQGGFRAVAGAGAVHAAN
jgi:hypothetical protein